MENIDTDVRVYRVKFTYMWQIYNKQTHCHHISHIEEPVYLDLISKSVFKSLNPLTPKILLVILPTVCQTILITLWCGEFGMGSISNPIIDIFLYYHHLSAWYCIDIVGRNSILITHGS